MCHPFFPWPPPLSPSLSSKQSQLSASRWGQFWTQFSTPKSTPETVVIIDTIKWTTGTKRQKRDHDDSCRMLFPRLDGPPLLPFVLILGSFHKLRVNKTSIFNSDFFTKQIWKICSIFNLSRNLWMPSLLAVVPERRIKWNMFTARGGTNCPIQTEIKRPTPRESSRQGVGGSMWWGLNFQPRSGA